MVRSAAAVVAGNCLVAATLIDSWLPWRTLSSGNQTGLPSTGEPPSPPVMGDPPQGATSTSTTSVWWGEWNFRVLLGWTNLMVFSTPEQKGSLGTEGGWGPLLAGQSRGDLLRAILASSWVDRPCYSYDWAAHSLGVVLEGV